MIIYGQKTMDNVVSVHGQSKCQLLALWQSERAKSWTVFLASSSWSLSTKVDSADVFCQAGFLVPDLGRANASQSDCQLVELVCWRIFVFHRTKSTSTSVSGTESGAEQCQAAWKPAWASSSLFLVLAVVFCLPLPLLLPLSLHSELLNWSDLQSIIAKEKFL